MAAQPWLPAGFGRLPFLGVPLADEAGHCWAVKVRLPDMQRAHDGIESHGRVELRCAIVAQRASVTQVHK